MAPPKWTLRARYLNGGQAMADGSMPPRRTHLTHDYDFNASYDPPKVCQHDLNRVCEACDYWYKLGFFDGRKDGMIRGNDEVCALARPMVIRAITRWKDMWKEQIRNDILQELARQMVARQVVARAPPAPSATASGTVHRASDQLNVSDDENGGSPQPPTDIESEEVQTRASPAPPTTSSGNVRPEFDDLYDVSDDEHRRNRQPPLETESKENEEEEQWEGIVNSPKENTQENASPPSIADKSEESDVYVEDEEEDEDGDDDDDDLYGDQTPQTQRTARRKAKPTAEAQEDEKREATSLASKKRKAPEDEKKAPKEKKQQEYYSKEEFDCLCDIAVGTIAEEQSRGEKHSEKWFFGLLRDRLNETYGSDRTFCSVKNQWCRKGRKATGVDERQKPRNKSMATSVRQPTKSKTQKKRKHEDDDDEDKSARAEPRVSKIQKTVFEDARADEDTTATEPKVGNDHKRKREDEEAVYSDKYDRIKERKRNVMEVATPLFQMGTDEMDIDIDLGPDYTEPPQTELSVVVSSSVPDQPSVPTQATFDITSEQTVLHKIHIRGVDDLTTNDIRSFSTENFPSHAPLRIEWIDDTSANIVFETADIALEALNNFTLHSNGDVASLHPVQLRAAKPLSTHPSSTLQIRTAISIDQKRPRAYEASRFYMMHPEHDPRENRRSSRTDGDYRRRRYGNQEQRRRKIEDAAEGFTASMYDDDADALATRGGALDRRSSQSSYSSGAHSGTFRGDTYRPIARDRWRSRDRSASPGKETDSRNRIRRRTPPPRYSSRDPNPFPRENNAKELFPSKLVTHDIGAELRAKSSNIKELFPTKKPVPNAKKELFPMKSGVSVHRRSDAFDAADETADLFATGMSVPFVDGAADHPSSHGRLKASDPDPIAEDLADLQRGGFSIRGASKQANQGFSIRGTAADTNTGSLVKELFPGKAGNAGKELFAERLKGRGTIRRTAADMFY